MKAYVEIHISLKLRNCKTLHDTLREFAQRNKGWMFPKEASEDYQTGHRQTACSIRDPDALQNCPLRSQAGFANCTDVPDLEPAAVAIANVNPKYPSTFRVTNIVPKMFSSLTFEQYNAIGLKFGECFRRFLRMSDHSGSVRIEGPEIGLKEVIKPAGCRRLFEAYLRTPDPLGHPTDIEALDRFICALSSYSRHKYTRYVDPDAVVRHLIEDRKWTSENAMWVGRRIRVGLDILAVNRRY
jgi:hypothetical protein